MSDPTQPGWNAPPAGWNAPPPGGYPGAPQYPPPYGTPPSANENLWILGAHLGVFILGFIAPLIAMLAEGRNNPRVRANAVEALNFQITLIIAAVAVIVLSFVLVGLLLVPVLAVVGLIMPIVAAVKASNEGFYRYPLTLRLVS